MFKMNVTNNNNNNDDDDVVSVYIVDFHIVESFDLWHNHLVHVNFHKLHNMMKYDLIRKIIRNS